ncbi:hypothetical protein EGW08_007952 [Elysia chlorotica]|uniref:G-protein coupled receptors family 1 profile domain-containing protein n=1 Tax=Elysia chlorotica TaxID=188477 RepID=A0A433TS21_ELYCH|nr:hypothetical protein EGW08_007952 [Elysia chlorotica]
MDHQVSTNCSDSETNQTISGFENQNAFDQLLERIFLLDAPGLSWTIFLFGIVAIVGNILTILVYARLGFAQTINMSYVALAVSDLFSVLTAMTGAFCFTPAMGAILQQLRVRVDLANLAAFVGDWPHFAFSKTTAILTAWVSVERCLCVLIPTRVRLIINRRVTKTVVSALFVLGCCPLVFAYIGMKTDWEFDAETNTTTLNIFYSFKKANNVYNSIAVLLYGAVYPTLSWVIVTTCTTFLIIKLRESARWRKSNSNGVNPNVPTGTTQKNGHKGENRITKTVVMIACVFITCSLPRSVHSLVSLAFRHKYSTYGDLRPLFVMNAGFALLLSEINSGTNIILYSITSRKFRSTLKEMVFNKFSK